MIFSLRTLQHIKKKCNFAFAKRNCRGVAQLAARHVRDVEVGSSSLLTPTNSNDFHGKSHENRFIVYF